MAFVLEDRVVETANNPGQGDFELLGAADNSRTFVDGIGNGNTTRYLAVGAEGWEIGVAEVAAGSPDRLLRPGTVKNMDGTTTPVNFTGTVTVACIASVEDVYTRANAVGPVARSGSLPTGAIVERGSNSGGEYVRYADGTQLCWGRFANGTHNDHGGGGSDPHYFDWSITFPAVFSDSNIAVTAIANSNAFAIRNVSAYGVSGSGCTIRLLSDNNQDRSMMYMAAGRWF